MSSLKYSCYGIFTFLTEQTSVFSLTSRVAPAEPLLCKFADGGQKKRQTHAKYPQNGRPWTREGEVRFENVRCFTSTLESTVCLGVVTPAKQVTPTKVKSKVRRSSTVKWDEMKHDWNDSVEIMASTTAAGRSPHIRDPLCLLAVCTPRCWWFSVCIYSDVDKKYELVLLRNGPCFQFDSLHWHLQENNDFFWGSKRTNWFEGVLTLSQPTIIRQNPWHTQQRGKKNKRFEQRSTRGRLQGGKFAYTKDPELVFHSSWHFHWHHSAQLWSPCLLIYGRISVTGLILIVICFCWVCAEGVMFLRTCLMLSF